MQLPNVDGMVDAEKLDLHTSDATHDTRGRSLGNMPHLTSERQYQLHPLNTIPTLTSPAKMPLSKVIVVGAGPSGLLLTLLLSRANIPVLLLEQTDILDTNPRASHYAEPSNYEFDRAGVLDAIRAEGFFPDGVSWRKLDENKTRLVMLRNPVPEDGQIDLEAERYRMVCLPLHKLGKILEDAVKREESAEEYRVVNFSPYRVHQRCVNRMRVGRVVLAADAAHLCNPL